MTDDPKLTVFHQLMLEGEAHCTPEEFMRDVERNIEAIARHFPTMTEGAVAGAAELVAVARQYLDATMPGWREIRPGDDFRDAKGDDQC